MGEAKQLTGGARHGTVRGIPRIRWFFHDSLVLPLYPASRKESIAGSQSQGGHNTPPTALGMILSAGGR